MNEKSTSTNAIVSFNIFSTIILQSLTFLTAPLISRMLGTENYGVASVYVAWVSFVSTILGIQTQSTLAPARNEFDISEQKKYQSSVYFLSILTYSLGSLLVVCGMFFVGKLNQTDICMVITLLIHGFGQFSVTFINIKNTYEFKAKQNFFITIGLASVSLILSVILISFLPGRINYWGRIMGLAVPYFLVSIGITMSVLKNGRTFYNKQYWKFCVSLCIPIVFHNISILILNQSDRVMIQKMMNNSAVGIYGLTYSFSSVLSAIWTALNNSWVPFFHEYTRKRNHKEMLEKARNYIELFTILCSGFVLLAPEVYKVFASEEYWVGVKLIPIFSLGFYFMFMYSFPVNYEFYYKKTKNIALGTMISAMINIALNYIFISEIGVFGAAAATAISYAVQYVFHHIYACKMALSEETGEYLFRESFFFKYLILLFCVVTIGYFMCSFFVVRWILGAAIGMMELYRIYKRKAVF